MLDSTEENDFENTIRVFLKGTEMVMEAKDRSDPKGCIFEERQQGKKTAGSAKL